jgi:hypothetical protein
MTRRIFECQIPILHSKLSNLMEVTFHSRILLFIFEFDCNFHFVNFFVSVSLVF